VSPSALPRPCREYLEGDARAPRGVRLRPSAEPGRRYFARFCLLRRGTAEAVGEGEGSPPELHAAASARPAYHVNAASPVRGVEEEWFITSCLYNDRGSL